MRELIIALAIVVGLVAASPAAAADAGTATADEEKRGSESTERLKALGPCLQIDEDLRGVWMNMLAFGSAKAESVLITIIRLRQCAGAMETLYYKHNQERRSRENDLKLKRLLEDMREQERMKR